MTREGQNGTGPQAIPRGGSWGRPQRDRPQSLPSQLCDTVQDGIGRMKSRGWGRGTGREGREEGRGEGRGNLREVRGVDLYLHLRGQTREKVGTEPEGQGTK